MKAEWNAFLEQEKKHKKDLENNRMREKELQTALKQIQEEREAVLEEKKKRREKPAIDYKTETIRIKKQNEMLESDRERQIKRLE